MRILRMLTAALLAVTAVLYIGNGLYTRLSGREVGPVIECPEEVLEISIYDGTQALLTGVTARDDQDGDLTDRVMVGGVSKLIGGDRAKITCCRSRMPPPERPISTGTSTIAVSPIELVTSTVAL